MCLVSLKKRPMSLTIILQCSTPSEMKIKMLFSKHNAINHRVVVSIAKLLAVNHCNYLPLVFQRSEVAVEKKCYQTHSMP